jgi:hypothetical protein
MRSFLVLSIGLVGLVPACGGDDGDTAGDTSGDPGSSDAGGSDAPGSGDEAGPDTGAVTGDGTGGGSATSGGSADADDGATTVAPDCSCEGPDAPPACPVDVGACGDFVEGQQCCDTRGVRVECVCNDLACFFDFTDCG